MTFGAADKEKIFVVGMGMSKEDLTGRHLALIRSGEILIGGRRHLDLFDDTGVETISITKDMERLFLQIRENLGKKRMVVLASGDPLHFVYSRLVMCGKAAGLKVIDAPYGNFRDAEGLKVAAARSRALGFDGKWVIHPSQIEEVNAAFAPTGEEIDRARRVLEAYETALGEGRGSAAIGGSMIDHASVRMARDVMERARATGLA
jgi:citrate lyase beta subunit